MSTRQRLFSILLLVLLLAPAGANARNGTTSGGAYVDPTILAGVSEGSETTAWVILRPKADLKRASKIEDWNERGQFVYDQLTRKAENTQKGLRTLLEQRGVAYEPFWIVNAIQVTADQAVIDELARRPEVEQILPTQVYQLPEPAPGMEEAEVQNVEWGIDRINAPDVWSTYGTRGEGIVVASIDTGVQFDHPALVAHYRGNQGGGAFDHSYNWFDPSSVCDDPLVPCDNNDHGTHVTGTMVGDDGGANQIGVAPGAKWIAAKGCESRTCSDGALLASGQWLLAPEDVNGQNPRPDLRPHIINNSWGVFGGDAWYQGIVDAWIASGIFPMFANGNEGPNCGTAGSPGDYGTSYGAGAFDSNNQIYSFSSRGASAFGGELKPNIAAPGVNVRSSIPGDGYASFNGTSMAAPHVSGTVALMWSAAPDLIGEIDATRELLDQSAIDTEDLQCGGTAEDNNVWGEGRLDAFAALSPSGILQGTVSSSSGSPISGATVDIVGPVTRTDLTDTAGLYSKTLFVGTYEITASAFGHQPQTAAGVEVSEGEVTTHDFTLEALPAFAVSGTVRESFFGQPVGGATVRILDTPIPPATTDADGAYSFDGVPEGSYTLQVGAGGCLTQQSEPLVVDGDVTLDFTLPLRMDSFGYFCHVTSDAYVEADTVLPLVGDDAIAEVALPFSFPFYGQTYSTAYVSTNGILSFQSSPDIFDNTAIPNSATPNAAIYPFWDDLDVDSSASVRTALLGSAPTREFVIEWRNVTFYDSPESRIDFEVVLLETGVIRTHYRNIAEDGSEQGNSATLGIENEAGTVGLQYSFAEAVVRDGLAILYHPPNDPPQVDAGGPYAGRQGSPISLTPSASDPDGDVLTSSWTYEAGDDVDAGATCAFDISTALATTITCTDDGTYTVSLTVDDGVYAPVNASATVTVNNVAPVIDAVFVGAPNTDPPSPQEGDSISAVASFSDPGELDSHTCTIDWGDDTIEDGVVTEANGSGTCASSHIYLDDGSYTITITVTDDDGGADTDSTTLGITNAAPSVDAGSDQTVAAGAPLDLAVSFTDLGTLDTHTATIDWGDGNQASGSVAEAGGSGTVAGSHLYADNGSYTVEICVTDDDGDTGCDSLVVTVANVVPLVATGGDATVDEGALFTRAGSFFDPGDDTWTATVDYGDGGGVQTLTLDGTNFTLSHVYTNGDGDPYTVEVCVSDGDSEGCDSFQVEVLNASEQMALLATAIEGMDLPNGVRMSLLNRLAEIDASIAAGETTDACNQLSALTNYVNAQVGKQLTQQQADQLIADVDRIHATLGCG